LGADAATGRGPPPLPRSSADAAGLGLATLAEILTNSHDGIGVIDTDQRWVYANRAACRMLGQPFELLQGQGFPRSIRARGHASGRPSLPAELEGLADPFAFWSPDTDGVVREIVCSTFAITVAGSSHHVAIFNDLTGPRTAARTAVALAQTTAQLVGAGTTEEILVGLARHGV
jgi:PAS domain S-box-containing protein